MNDTDARTERLERLWSLLAQAIDCAGPAHETLFLTKLVLLLGERIDDPAVVEQLAATALRDLD